MDLREGELGQCQQGPRLPSVPKQQTDNKGWFIRNLLTPAPGHLTQASGQFLPMLGQRAQKSVRLPEGMSQLSGLPSSFRQPGNVWLLVLVAHSLDETYPLVFEIETSWEVCLIKRWPLLSPLIKQCFSCGHWLANACPFLGWGQRL